MSKVCPKCKNLTTEAALKAYKSCAPCHHKTTNLKPTHELTCNKCSKKINSSSSIYYTLCSCSGRFELY